MEQYLSGNLYSNTANFYDYDNRDIIKDDLDFYVEYAGRTRGPILELASGTGRVSLYLAEKTNRTVECVELSTEMLESFSRKLETTHRHLRELIRLHNADMSNFNLGRLFELVIIPWRALQWLPEKEKTIDCLRCVREHLTKDGLFVFDIFRPRTYDEKWIGREDISYDITDGNRRIIRSTINHSADTEKKFIRYINKIKVLENGTETVKEDLLTIKYYDYDDISGILKDTGFIVKEQYGYYDKRSLKDGEEMIFVCAVC